MHSSLARGLGVIVVIGLPAVLVGGSGLGIWHCLSTLLLWSWDSSDSSDWAELGAGWGVESENLTPSPCPHSPLCLAGIR